MLREQRRRLRADVADAEAEEQPVERPLPALIDRVEDVLGALLGHAVEGEQLVFRQRVEAGRVGDKLSL